MRKDVKSKAATWFGVRRFTKVPSPLKKLCSELQHEGLIIRNEHRPLTHWVPMMAHEMQELLDSSVGLKLSSGTLFCVSVILQVQKLLACSAVPVQMTKAYCGC